MIFFTFKLKQLKSIINCQLICISYQKEVYLMLELSNYGFSLNTADFVTLRPFCFFSQDGRQSNI